MSSGQWAKPGGDQAKGLDADHQVPAGTAVGSGNRFDDADLGHGVCVGAMELRWRRHPVEPLAGERFRHGSRQVAFALRLVGMFAHQ